MLDECVELVVLELCCYVFNNKMVGQCVVIIVVGLVVNFIFVIFVYWLVFIIGVSGVCLVIGEIMFNLIVVQV